jgi:hypothetical protein
MTIGAHAAGQATSGVELRHFLRACVGELIQIDGSDHAWFEGRAEACTLLVYIDDATSRLTQLLLSSSNLANGCQHIC